MTSESKELNRFNHALNFVARGIRIIPLRPNTKEPLITDWKRNASADPDQIRKWFDQYPDCNFALLMGEGIVVLDVDTKNGKNGLASLKQLIGANQFFDTLVVATPSGGAHYYLRTQQDLATKHGFLDGLDFQAVGSYVVAPGSAINGIEYRIVSDSTEIASIPDWLLTVVAEMPAVAATSAPETQRLVAFKPAARVSSDKTEMITGHLKGIDPDLPRDEWIQTLFAIQNVFGKDEQTIELLRSWSVEGATYTDKDFDKAVSSCDPDKAIQVGVPRLLEISRKFPRPDRWLPHHEEALDLESRVMSTVVEMLERHDNKPNPEHLHGIKAIVKAMTHGLFENERKFRKAFPLETGMGKTTCVVALVKELQDTDKSLLISAERIEQLEELQQQLVAEGVAPAKLGIFHSSESKYPECPSVKPAELDQVQFLLAAHNRLKGDSQRSITERLMAYKGQPRDMVIWDESLLTTSSHSLDRATVRKAIGNWIIDYEEKRAAGRKSPCNDDLYQNFHEFLASIGKQLALDESSGVFELPPLRFDAKDYEQPINAWSRKDETSADLLKKLVEYAERGEVRTLKTQDSHALVQFIQTVDDGLDKMIILDASASIRDLVRYDRSIGVHPLTISKDYGNVTLKWADIGSSKDSFNQTADHLMAYLGEMDYLLWNEIPKGEPFLIFCHMQLKERIRQWANDAHPLRDIHVLHWGQHRASNRYSHIQYVATVGVLYRDTKEIAASIVGQTRNLHYGLVDADIRQTQNSEQADLLYQGISRGNSRRTISGKAGKQVIYLFHPARDFESILPLLKDVMPGLNVEDYKPAVLKRPIRKNALDYTSLGEKVVDHLIRIPSAQESVSVRSVKGAVAADCDPNSSLWRKGKTHALNQLTGWKQKGQLFERSSGVQ
jgi:hypothetical protein